MFQTRISIITLILCLLTAGGAGADPEAREALIVECQGRCDLSNAIAALGGEVTRVFANVDACAVEVPRGAVPAVSALPGVTRLEKDALLNEPEPDQAPALTAGAMTKLSHDELLGMLDGELANYAFNNVLTGAATLHAEGTLGEGIVVAVIDSGTANNPDVVQLLAGSVIGGESFVPPEQDSLSATSTLNHSHGTWTACMVAAHGGGVFPSDSYDMAVIGNNAPDSIFPCEETPLPPEICPPGFTFLPVTGSAPGASLYAMKVRRADAGGVFTSWVIAAMDRALTLRRNFNQGMPSLPRDPGCGGEDDPCVYDSLPIQVVTMSVGSTTLFPGGELRDKLTLAMLDEGMVVTASAGNGGPAAMTGYSPASGRGSLAAGAASTAAHERIRYDLYYGLGTGRLVRPFDGLQTAEFSARGPTADGRIFPDLAANGMAPLTQGADGETSLWLEGTSYAAPTVAGAAALLREEFPEAPAVAIRNALVTAANPELYEDGSGALDRGAGFLDVPAARALLAAGTVSTELPAGLASPSVEANIALLGYRPVQFVNRQFSTRIEDLLPGQVAQFFVDAPRDAVTLVVSLTDLTPELPPEAQNQIWGDDLLLAVADAPTSHTQDTYRVYDFVTGDASFVIDDPQTGLMRVAVMAATSNAGRVSADLHLELQRAPLPPRGAFGILPEGEVAEVRFAVPAGTAELDFRLDWVHHWGFYPASDLDLYLEDPAGVPIFDGAALKSPERVFVDSPAAGVWTARVHAFLLHEEGLLFPVEPWALRVTADGEALRALR